MTAQVLTSEGSQIATKINDKLGVGEFVFLDKAVEEHRRGVCSAAAEHVHFEQEFQFRVDCSVEPFLLAVNFDLFLIDCDGAAVGGSLCVLASVSFCCVE
jgi:hypothetical protein